MPTDKEVAAALRTIAERDVEEGCAALAATRRRRADLLDPPKPTYPDGTIAWVTIPSITDSGRIFRALTVFVDGVWRYGVDNCLPVHNPAKVEPLRVLADDEIAIKRVRNANASALRLRVRTNRNNLQVSLSKVDEDVLLAVAEALEVEADEAAEETTR